jgi:hypothetical protein
MCTTPSAPPAQPHTRKASDFPPSIGRRPSDDIKDNYHRCDCTHVVLIQQKGTKQCNTCKKHLHFNHPKCLGGVARADDIWACMKCRPAEKMFKSSSSSSSSSSYKHAANEPPNTDDGENAALRAKSRSIYT